MKKKNFYIIVFLLCARSIVFADTPIYVTHLWHMHQPIYTPGDPAGDSAYSTIQRNGTSDGKTFSYSLNDMWASKGGPYRGWPTDALEQGLDLPHLGAQVDITGSLCESLDNLEANNWNGGFYNNWKSRWYTGMNYKTSLNHPRLDVIHFPYHHPMLGLLWDNDVVLQFLMNKKLLQDNFPGYTSKGLFPPETCLSERNITALVKAGIEWVMVDNIHFFRTLSDYPWTSASGDVEPNKADQINGTASERNTTWVQLNGLWAPNKVAAGWGYRPHYAQTIDPSTGVVSRIMVVPAACYEGNEDARGGFGALSYDVVLSQLLPYNTDPSHPQIVLLHHDGENYGAGSESYYHSNFGNYCNWLRNNPTRFVGTTIQDYLDMFPPDPGDVIHIENGGWIGSGCLSPEFSYWLGDPNPYPTGQSPDWNSWAVITAARNWVMTAYAVSKAQDNADYFDAPESIANEINGKSTSIGRALHYYTRSQASCYEYWEGGPDEGIWNGNPTRSCNKAIDVCQSELGINASSDRKIGPSIFIPQRQPYNPGGMEWGKQQSKDFEVWSFVYDLNGLNNVYLKYRILSGPSIADSDRLYSTGTWFSNLMPYEDRPWSESRTTGPAPLAKARRYFSTITSTNNKFYAYYIEALDSLGNKARSPIQFVWVGAGGSGGSTSRWTPPNPTQNDLITVTGDKAGKLHWGVNNWTLPATNYWPSESVPWGDGKSIESPLKSTNSKYQIQIGPFNKQQAVTKVDFVFHYSDGSWDNNNGQDYHITITIVTGNQAPGQPQNLQSRAGCNLVKLTWDRNTEADMWLYEIYRKRSGASYQKIKALYHPTNMFNDYNCSNGVSYNYYAVAVDTGTNRSNPSIETFTTPQQKPARPTGVSASVIEQKVHLQWNLNTEPDIFQFNILRSRTSGSGYTGISIVHHPTNSSDDEAVNPYTNYYYVITAQNISNYQSLDSAEVMAYLIGQPLPPSHLRGTASTNKITLVWDENYEPDIHYYNIYRKTIPGVLTNKPAFASITNRTNTRYEDTKVTNGRTYFYIATAVNSNGKESAASSECSVEVTGRPQPPSGFSATGFEDHIKLEWNANMETNIRGYVIYRSNAQVSHFSNISLLITNRLFHNDYFVLTNVWYYYTATAVNKLGLESIHSLVKSAKITNFVPTIFQPSGLSATLLSNSILLSWNNNNPGPSGTLILRNQESGHYYPAYQILDLQQYPEGQTFGDGLIVFNRTDQTRFTNMNLTYGRRYYYNVYCYRIVNGKYYYSMKVQSEKSVTLPAVRNFSKRSGFKFVDLDWSPVPGSYLSGYMLKRIRDHSTNLVQAGLIAATNFRDAGIDYDRLYQYMLEPVDLDLVEGEPRILEDAGVFRPRGLASTVDYNRIQLIWGTNREEYLAGYNIYKGIVGGTAQRVNPFPVAGTRFVDSEVSLGLEYEYFIKAVDVFTNESQASGTVSSHAVKSLEDVLEIRNNLFSPGGFCTIWLKAEENESIKIRIFDATGKLIKTIWNGRVNTTGIMQETWDGRDNKGDFVGSGMYLCIVEKENKKYKKPVVFVK